VLFLSLLVFFFFFFLEKRKEKKKKDCGNLKKSTREFQPRIREVLSRGVWCRDTI